MNKTAGHGREIKRQKVIAALKAGNTRKAAAHYAGINQDTLYAWLEENPSFSESVREAEATAEVICATTILKCAQKGDWRAADKWLSKRRRDDWADEINVRDLSIEQLLALAKAGPGPAGRLEDPVAGRNGDREPDKVSG